MYDNLPVADLPLPGAGHVAVCQFPVVAPRSLHVRERVAIETVGDSLARLPLQVSHGSHVEVLSDHLHLQSSLASNLNLWYSYDLKRPRVHINISPLSLSYLHVILNTEATILDKHKLNVVAGPGITTQS